jgi:MerR family transcriptional regulator, mercuric resistance operon regulatory protein
MTAYSISKLAIAAGTGVETVRFYQRSNLMPRPPGRQSGLRNGIHYYDETDLKRLRFIRTAQRAGFKLSEIAELLRLDASSDRRSVRDLAHQRIAELDAKIAELAQARAVLENLATECAASDVGPCPIIAAFDTPPPTR